jgi:hypothetical protein
MSTRTLRSKRGAPIEIKEEGEREEEVPNKRPKSSPVKEVKEEMSGPRNWRALYSGIKEFRKINNKAAVDTDGCDMLAAQKILPKVWLRVI